MRIEPNDAKARRISGGTSFFGFDAGDENVRLISDRASEIADPTALTEDLRPHLGVLAGGSCAIALVSFVSLPWPIAIASTLLGALMVAGADVDARTLLLPDAVTLGAAVLGIVVIPSLDAPASWWVVAATVARALAAAAIVGGLRLVYGWARGREGLGLGDVKLAAAVGAWLPVDAIPVCIALATAGALVAVGLARLRGEAVDNGTRVPFGAFLCPALWLSFYGSAVLQASPYDFF